MKTSPADVSSFLARPYQSSSVLQYLMLAWTVKQLIVFLGLNPPLLILSAAWRIFHALGFHVHILGFLADQQRDQRNRKAWRNRG